VLDRVVPGYYHRYNETSGAIETSPCCANTASEFAMMGKLMDDTMVRFVEDYKITGFRYDLMGFHTKAQMEALLAKLRAIDPSVYIYGEGWNFGEVASDRRFVQATQLNLGGTGIGTFTDRIRDAVRGGGPFDSGILRTSNQGFINGGGYDPNDENAPDDEGFVSEALCTSDQIRASMAGSIKSYAFEDRTGATVTGAELGYPNCENDTSTPVGYVDDPEEIINYVASHDNETIWDISQYKHAKDVSAADRVRAENVGVDSVLLAQGVPFLHSGQDLLRSKSVDRDSFDFGDWFNRQDFSKMDNNWAVGLPNAEKNQGEWPDITELFDNPNSQVTAEDIQFASQHTLEMLQVRGSTVLYRLPTAQAIVDRIEYFNTGPDQVPGLIVQGIDGCVGGDLEPEFGYVVNILNANDEDQTIELFTDQTFELHPVLQSSVDTVVQTATHGAGGFFVPARTTAVFVKTQDGTECGDEGGGPGPGAGYDDADFFVRGGFNDWGITNPMTEVGDSGIFESTISVATGGYDYKIASEDWATVNCGGPVGGGVLPVELDAQTTLACGDGTENMSSSFPADGGYQVSLDTAGGAAPTLLVKAQTGAGFGAGTLFVRGGFNGWSEDNPMTAIGAGGYEAVVTVPAGAAEFKIATADWSTVNCGASTLGGALPVAAGADTAISCDANSGNLAGTFDATDYKFSVSENPASAGNPSLFFEPLSGADYSQGIFVRGGFNGWSEDNPMSSTEDTVYQAVVPVTAGTTEFKIASADWSAANCGQSHFGNVGTLAPGTTTAISCDDNSGNLVIDIPADGNLTFTLDAAVPGTPTLTISGP
jgi:pullulanase